MLTSLQDDMMTSLQEVKKIIVLHLKSISNPKLRPTHPLTWVKSRDASASKNHARMYLDCIDQQQQPG